MNKRVVSIFSALILFLIIFTPIVPVEGVTWSDETQLTTYGGWDTLPSITQMSDSRIWVVWQSRNTHQDIYYKIYNLTTGLWTDDTPLITDVSHDTAPSIIQVENGTIWVFWSSNSTGNYNIFYITSSDNGDNWTDSFQLTADPGTDSNPSVAQAEDGKIWVVWQRQIDADQDIFYRIYNGSWSDEMPLITGPSYDRLPSIAHMTDGRTWVAWHSFNRTGTEAFDIFYTVYNGSSWHETQLTNSSNIDVDPTVLQDRNGMIWVVWASHEPIEEYQDDLYYKTSCDNGGNWTDRVQLYYHPNDDLWPSIAQISDKKIWIVYVSNRNNNYDLYYKTSSEIPVHDVATTKITLSSTTVYQGENVTINVVAENQGEFAETFNVTAYANTTVIGTQNITDLAPGVNMTLFFTWNTTSVLPGHYVISATAETVPGECMDADNKRTGDTVQVKIIGDIDGDGDVDPEDFASFAGAYGTSPPSNPECDLDGDGDVDPEDFATFAGKYGRHV